MHNVQPFLTLSWRDARSVFVLKICQHRTSIIVLQFEIIFIHLKRRTIFSLFIINLIVFLPLLNLKKKSSDMYQPISRPGSVQTIYLDQWAGRVLSKQYISTNLEARFCPNNITRPISRSGSVQTPYPKSKPISRSGSV